MVRHEGFADLGTIVLLNGVPRSGKSSLARALQAIEDLPLLNLGVDSTMASTPADHLPGIGLRPGTERPDLEGFIQQNYRALFDSIGAHSNQGLGVVADLGIHDSYSRPLGLWREAAGRLAGLPAYVIGVRCSLEDVLDRRAADPGRYQVAAGHHIPDAILRWEQSVHDPGWYDLEVNTSSDTASDCAEKVREHIRTNSPTELGRHLD